MSAIIPAIPSGAAQALPMQRSRGYWTSALLRFTRDPVAMGAALVVLLLIALAVFGPWLAPADPYQSSMLKRLKPIGTEGLPLGSDELGRDMLSRLIVGARLSLFMGITPVICAFILGATIGISRAMRAASSTR
jgi:peptide/nickel transport system permease protein